MRTTKLASLVLLALVSVGCANGRQAFPATTTDLALERVVLYRNGIGYFERHGEVDDSTLRIRVRRDQINDLLKSLTVVDKNGQAVSVSMPLDPESWASAALSALTPGQGSLAQLLDGLRGTDVTLYTTLGRIRGRLVLVERTVDEPDPDAFSSRGGGADGPSQRDYKVTLMKGNELQVVRLSKVRDVELHDGDLAMQLHRRLDASSGEGMFQQVEVAIALVGAKSHDVSVSYVVAAPMWKPTYRVVLPESGKGQALLQGWAVVDNTSGEDWSQVKLSLTSGEPIAFQYDLHTPRTVTRSDLTEAGVYRRATVALGETSYGEYDEEPMAEPAEAMDGVTELYDYEEQAAQKSDWTDDESDKGSPKLAKKAGNLGLSGTGRGGGGRAAPASPAGPMGGVIDAKTSAVDLDALRRSTLADARAKQVSGMTRFDLDERITVPNGSSTMVAILNRQVDAEQTFLYRPGGAGIGYDANPYRVVRFQNSTPFVLEPGPISIYSGGSFVGEGLSEAVSTGTSATIPFAVEPSIMVSSSSAYTGDEMHLLRISRGVLEVESFSRTTTTWTAKGKPANEPYNVLVRHNKAGWNYELVDPPKGTEVLPDGYLIRVEVAKGKSEGSTVVVEQTPSTTSISIWDYRALGLLETLVLSAELTPDMRAKIQPVVELRREIGRIDTEVDGLKVQQIELDQRANETRQNLEAIKKDPAASSLRKKLSDRLDDFTRDGDRIGRKIVELQSLRLEKKISLEDLLENLDLSAPPSKPAKPGAKPDAKPDAKPAKPDAKQTK